MAMTVESRAPRKTPIQIVLKTRTRRLLLGSSGMMVSSLSSSSAKPVAAWPLGGRKGSSRNRGVSSSAWAPGIDLSSCMALIVR